GDDLRSGGGIRPVDRTRAGDVPHGPQRSRRPGARPHGPAPGPRPASARAQPPARAQLRPAPALLGGTTHDHRPSCQGPRAGVRRNLWTAVAPVDNRPAGFVSGGGQNRCVLMAAVPTWGGAGRLRVLDESGAPAGPPEEAADLAAAVAARDRAGAPRWVWPDTSRAYPALLAAGVPVGRCHDLALVEALLLGHAGAWGEPRSLAAGR